MNQACHKMHLDRSQETLLHGEALLIVATANAEDIAFELIPKGIARHFSSHSLIKERIPSTKLAGEEIHLGRTESQTCQTVPRELWAIELDSDLPRPC